LTHTSDVLNKNNIVSEVDDETEAAHLLIEALHSIRGINVFKFTDPSMALEHFKTNKEDYALMISNLRLPVINGCAVAKDCKRFESFSENSSNNRI
jgi:DNA-binding response OmpR family regulator